MNNFLNSIKTYKYFTLFIVLSFFFIKCYLIFNNYIDTERGDGSAYFYDGIFGLERFTNVELWLKIHPPLSFISSSMIYTLYDSVNLFSIVSYIKFSLLINTILYLLASFVVYLLVKKSFGIKVGLIAVLFFSSAGLLQIFTLNGSAETYALLYFVLSIYFFISYLNNKTISLIILSAFMLLLASMCRTEVLALVPIIMIFIWIRGYFLHSVLFGIIVTMFEVFKLTMKYVIYDGSIIGYENMEKIWDIKSKTFEQLLFNNHTLDYFLYSFNFYFTIIILIITLLLFLKKEYKVFISLFLFMSFVLLYFQYNGRIVMNDRYAFFPIILFVFVISSVFHYIFSKYIIKIRGYKYVFLFVALLSIWNFNQAITEKISRVPISVIDTRVWLEENILTNDYIFLDFMNYWSLNIRLYLQAKFPLNKAYSQHWYYYAIGNTYVAGKNSYGIKKDKDIYNDYNKSYIDKVLESPYLKTTSPDWRLKQKIVAELFIKDKKPKYFIVPKRNFQKYIKFSYIKNKIISLNEKKSFIKFEYLNFEFILLKKYENKGFIIYEADYSKNLEINKIKTISKNFNKKYFRVKGNNQGLFAEIYLHKTNCIKNAIVSVGFYKNNKHENAKYIYYYVNKRKNIISLSLENLIEKSKNFKISEVNDIIIYLYQKDKNLTNCIQEINLYTIKENK